MDSNRANLDDLASWPPIDAGPETSLDRIGQLPMPELTINSAQAGRFEYCFTTTCCHGQLWDRTPVKLMDWHPDQPIALVVKGSAVVGFDDSHGSSRFGPRGHLRLPAITRHQCGIGPGQKVLVATCVDHRCVIVYPTAAIDQALSSLHELALSAVR
jgi:hypothetical protein